MSQSRIPSGKTRTLSRVLLFTGLASATTALSGCLLNRVSEVRQQFCDFDGHFEINFASEGGQEYAEFRFLDPVLLADDITWMVGTNPTRIEEDDQGLEMTWVVDKVSAQPSEDESFQVEMSFVAAEEQYRLAEIRFDPQFNTMINAEFLDPASLERGAAEICNVGWSRMSTRVEVDLSEQDLDELPSRDELLDWLGPPLHWNPAENSYTYEYRFRNDDEVPLTTRFTLWYDESGDQPLRMDSDYSRFTAQADFVEKKMAMKVSL